jgi:hypothetical protein
MDPTRLRHDLRGCFFGLRLAVEAALEETEPRERVEWLDGIIEETGRCIEILDEHLLREEGQWVPNEGNNGPCAPGTHSRSRAR